MGQFIILTGPSASGKTRLADELLKRVPKSTRLVTTTTRAPRPGEKHGVHYYFISRAEFEEGVTENEFFEYAEVYGNRYGASSAVLKSSLANFDFVIAVVDVQGSRWYARQVPGARTLFIRPRSVEELERRLRIERPGMSDENLRTRVKIANDEIAIAHTFDRVLDNIDGQFESTVEQAIAFVNETAPSRA